MGSLTDDWNTNTANPNEAHDRRQLELLPANGPWRQQEHYENNNTQRIEPTPPGPAQHRGHSTGRAVRRLQHSRRRGQYEYQQREPAVPNHGASRPPVGHQSSTGGLLARNS